MRLELKVRAQVQARPWAGLAVMRGGASCGVRRARESKGEEEVSERE